MDQEIAIVHQYPFRCVVSLNTDRQLADFLEAFLNLIGDGVALARIRNGTDNEVIRKRSDLAKIEHNQIKGFLRFRPVECQLPVRQFRYGAWLRVNGTARQIRLNLLLRLAYYSFAASSIEAWHNWILR